jgi:hypothetical protein
LSGDDVDADEGRRDWAPFSPSPVPGSAQIALTPIGMNRVRNEEKRALHQSVEAWARRQGYVVDDSIVVAEVEGVRTTIALYEITEALAVVRATARMPVDVSVLVEPRTLKHDLGDRLSKPFRVGDPELDRAWHIETDNADLARVVLDDTCRSAIQALGAVAWSRTLYERGRIEIRLDAEGLAGGHVALAIQLAVGLGRIELSASPYR